MSDEKKILSGFLKKVGEEVADFAEGSEMVSRSNMEALARQLWRQALGYQEDVRDPMGNLLSRRAIPPDFRSQSLLLERLEGKAIPLDQKDETGVSLLDRIDDAITSRVNAIADGQRSPEHPDGGRDSETVSDDAGDLDLSADESASPEAAR